MNNSKQSPIVIIAFFPIFILKYAYIGILSILGINKKRHMKDISNEVVEDDSNDLKEAAVQKAEIKNTSTITEKASNDDVSKLNDNTVISGKKSLVGSVNKLYTFNYSIRLNNGKIYKNSFDAPNINEVERFLKNEGYDVVSIVPRNKYDIDLNIGVRLKEDKLAFILTQLSTYLKAGIPLVDSVRIVAKQSTKKFERKVWEKVVYDLLSGKSFSDALEDQEKVFPAMLINMIKTAELTGALTEILDDMADYYKSTSQTKKEMKSALTYPSVIFVMAIAVSAFMLIVIVPSFVDMFNKQNADIPGITKAIMAFSTFLKTNYIFILIVLIITLVTYIYLFNKVKAFKRVMQAFYMKLPVFGKIIIYNEVTIFTKTFSSLINHGVKISESMDILLKITSNEIYKELINETIKNLTKGRNVSESFKGNSNFPVVAYEMLVTGESTGQLGAMMSKVSDHFGNLHKNMISQMKSLIEPIMIIFLAFVVGGIVLSLIVPMFSIYNQL